MPLATVMWYLLGINVVAFIVYALDATLDRGSVPVAITRLVTVAGGSLGTLVALLVWGGRRRKDAARERIVAVVWLAVHISVLFVFYGPGHEAAQERIADFYAGHMLLCWYLTVINIATFIAYAADKLKAMAHAWRIPEAVLLGMTAVGGSLGALLAMDICHHKVRTRRFVIGVPVLLCVHLALLALLAHGTIW